MTEPRRLGDRYELGEVLGYGGMAEVHRGRDVRLGRDVAIKTLRVDLSREQTFQNRFRREAQSAAALNHPSIVAVYDTGESVLDGVPVPYIVMEYVAGRTLRDVLRLEPHIMPTRALEIVSAVLKALDYSHRNGIVHRDIKPGNVMLTQSGDVKVMDFGIARAVAESSVTVTQTAAVIGTAQYLSPEQARGEPVDPRSDIYSTGCLLYELLAGTPPFTGDSAVAVAYQHVREDPIPPSRLNADVSPALDSIVLKAMAKNPANRYQTAGEMRDDIERALAGRPVQATPILTDPTVQMAPLAGDPPQRRQPRGRRSLTYVLLGLVAIALLVGVGLLVRQALTTKHGPTSVKVPTVRQKSQADAEAALRGAGFKTSVTMQPNGTVQKGIVFDQSPPAGTMLVIDSTVTIVVSSGPSSVGVPNLKGKSLSDAKTTLQQEKLKLGKVQKQDSQQPADTVLDQTPQPGQNISAGQAVDVVVASGTGTVPDVRGVPADQAETELTNAGYRFQVQPQASTSVQENYVINQLPGHDTKAKIGSTVTLFVSSGAPTPPPSTPPPSSTAPSSPAASSPGTTKAPPSGSPGQ